MFSKHVEAYNKSYYKPIICVLNWLINKIILRGTVSKTSKHKWKLRSEFTWAITALVKTLISSMLSRVPGICTLFK